MLWFDKHIFYAENGFFIITRTYRKKSFGKKRDNHKLFLEIYKVRAKAAYFQAKSKNDLVHGQE